MAKDEIDYSYCVQVGQVAFEPMPLVDAYKLMLRMRSVVSGTAIHLVRCEG